MTGVPPRSLGELREDVLGDAPGALLLHALEARSRKAGILDAGDQLVGAERPVPELQRLHLAELGHGLAVGADAGGGHVRGHGVLEAIVPAGHHEAGAEPLQVPLPGRRERLVEVVDGEDDPPLRGGEAAEVAQVGVAAALDADPGGGRRGQVGRHGERRPPVERERRADHAPVAEREQLGHASLLRRQDHLDRVPPDVGGLPRGVRGPGAGHPQRLARGVLLGAGEALERSQGPAAAPVWLRWRRPPETSAWSWAWWGPPGGVRTWRGLGRWCASSRYVQGAVSPAGPVRASKGAGPPARCAGTGQPGPPATPQMSVGTYLHLDC